MLVLFWICIFAIAAGPIIFFRMDLLPSLTTCSSKTSGRALDAARFKEGCSVAFMSICRIIHIILIIYLTFDSEAPTYACVEFSFNRPTAPYEQLISYSTPLLVVIQGVFYPIFLLAGGSFLHISRIVNYFLIVNFKLHLLQYSRVRSGMMQNCVIQVC